MRRYQVVHLCRGRDWRGGERQVRLLVRTLTNLDEGSHRVATGHGSRLASALLEDEQPTLLLPWSMAYDPRSWGPLVRQLQALTASGDRVLLHAHDSHALALGLLASRRLGLALVATRRSVSAPGPLWRRPDRVIAISGAVEQALVASGVRESCVVRIPSAIDLAAVQRVVPLTGSEPPGVIAAGALTAEKGHATLIDAFALLDGTDRGSRLLILGEGPERRSLEARANRRGVGSVVCFAGEVPDATSRIAGAQLFIQPSHQEALGTAVLEAMALGIPVVASQTGGLTELVGGGAGLLVPPRNPGALASAIEYLLAHPHERARYGAAGRLRVAQYDASGMAVRVAEVYRSALGDT